MDLVETIRNRAMLDVMEGGFLYQYRRICRWFSSKFYTPLPLVMDMPEEEVLQAFFETQFEDMSKRARRKMAVEMTETVEEAQERRAEEDSRSDDAFLKKQEEIAAKEEKAALKKLKNEAKEAAEKLAAMADQEMVSVPSKKTRKSKAKKPKPPPTPEISMSFDPNSGNLLDEESVQAPPPRKR